MKPLITERELRYSGTPPRDILRRKHNDQDRDGGISLFFFGNGNDMNGKITANSKNEIINSLRQLYINGDIFGSICLSRKQLAHQHFVIDFDLKKIPSRGFQTPSPPCNAEYQKYIEIRDTTTERHLMSRSNLDGQEGCYNQLNPNYFVYELLYILVEIFKINWLPIYILGKGKGISRGFHLEIPDLVMSYYDITLLSEACYKIISNQTLFDFPENYSIFGSHKYPSGMTISTDTLLPEADYAYLPYISYYRGTFNDVAGVFDFATAFDTFNILKEFEPDTKIYAFPTHHSTGLFSSFFSPQINERTQWRGEDNTIPEYQRLETQQRNEEEEEQEEEEQEEEK